MPSFNNNSEAIRSSPHVRFAVAMSAISRCRSAGTRGRPRARDFHRQNNRNPFRCHRISVSGFTIVRMRRQSISHDSPTSAIRVASSARRGLTWRSAYNASCFLRNRFSAASWPCDRSVVATNCSRSPAIRRTVRTAVQGRDWAMAGGSYAIHRGPLASSGVLERDPTRIGRGQSHRNWAA
jgi:hypothetical protein